MQRSIYRDAFDVSKNKSSKVLKTFKKLQHGVALRPGPLLVQALGRLWQTAAVRKVTWRRCCCWWCNVYLVRRRVPRCRRPARPGPYMHPTPAASCASSCSMPSDDELHIIHTNTTVIYGEIASRGKVELPRVTHSRLVMRSGGICICNWLIVSTY